MSPCWSVSALMCPTTLILVSVFVTLNTSQLCPGPARPYICGLQHGPTRRPGPAPPVSLVWSGAGVAPHAGCQHKAVTRTLKFGQNRLPPPVAAAADGLFCGGARGTLWTPTPAFDIEFLINIYTHSGVRSPHDISPGQTLQIKCLLVKTFSHRGD